MTRRYFLQIVLGQDEGGASLKLPFLLDIPGLFVVKSGNHVSDREMVGFVVGLSTNKMVPTPGRTSDHLK